MILTSACAPGEPLAFRVRDVVRLPLPRRAPKQIVVIVDLPAGAAEVVLCSTRSGYGGRRYWFFCPGCERRVGILFTTVPHPMCRSCAGLTFPSDRIRSDRPSQSWQRLAHDLGRVRRLLARRYHRLSRRGELERQAAALDAALCAELAGIGDMALLWSKDGTITAPTFGHLR